MSAPYAIESTGPTVEEAISNGLEKLGVGPGQVIVEVLEEPSKGLFGLGSKQARVRLQMLTPPPAAPPASKPSAPEASPEIPSGPADTAPTPEPAPSQVDDEPPPPDETEPSPVPDAAPLEEPQQPADSYEDDFFNEDGTYEDVDVQPVTPAKPTPASTDKPDREDQDRPPREARPPRKKRPRGERYHADEFRSRPKHKKKGRSRRQQAHREESEAVPPPLEFDQDHAYGIGEQVLVELLDVMDIPATIDTSPPDTSDTDADDTPWILNIQGVADDVTPLIGRKGDTLSALQYLTRLIVSKQIEARANIIVDVDNYRLKRSEKVANLANRMADQAVETGRSIKLEPMPPHERRIVHITLRRRDDVYTESDGRGDSRRVMIFPNVDTEV